MREDLAAWNAVAARCGVAPARALACPWGNSGGASEATWRVLNEAGVTAVTRAARTSGFCSNSLDRLVPQPHPVFPQVVLFPDLFVTAESEAKTYAWVARAAQSGGAVDLWVHPSDLVPANEAVWRRLVGHLGGRGDLWVAPVAEIGERWRLTRTVRTSIVAEAGGGRSLVVENPSGAQVDGLALEFPTAVLRAELHGRSPRLEGRRLVLDLPPRTTVKGRVWLAHP